MSAEAPVSIVRAKRGEMISVKEEVRALLKRLPDDCTVEDIQYHLYVLEKVRGGLERADSEGGVSQDDAEARLSRWLTE